MAWIHKLENPKRYILSFAKWCLLGLESGICGALGLIGLFSCATNSPLAAIILSAEIFGITNLYLFALICVACFVLSGHSGLYASQILRFSKADLNEKHLREIP